MLLKLALGLFFISLCGDAHALLDLEKSYKNDFFISTKQIHIPGYPRAHNPSLVRWNGRLLLSFRTSDPKEPLTSWVGLAWLDEQYHVVGKATLLPLRTEPGIPSRCEDARLLVHEDKLYVIYNDKVSKVYKEGDRRIFFAEVEYSDGVFSVKRKKCYHKFEDEKRLQREKNWVPFLYDNKLLLGYSLLPHKIIYDEKDNGECITIASTKSAIEWPWGILRGGTPAHLINENEYLAFFHTSKQLHTSHYKEGFCRTYVMGAYTFDSKPPFAIKKFSKDPIVGVGFYSGVQHHPFWTKARVVFPGGYITDQKHIILAYGRADCEVWIATFDKEKLVQSLIEVSVVNE